MMQSNSQYKQKISLRNKFVNLLSVAVLSYRIKMAIFSKSTYDNLNKIVFLLIKRQEIYDEV